MLGLVIGNRNYSSWSLRAWLYCRWSGLEVEVTRLPMFTEEWREEVLRYSPAGRVPVLIDGDLRIWDTFAIFEHLRETRSGALDHPSAPAARALSRSISAEMHSGFLQLRDELPQNLRARKRRDLSELSESCRRQVERIETIWSECRRRWGSSGPWLFGERSLADAVYAPVALRYVTYEVSISAPASDFITTVRSDPDVRDWVERAGRETESLPFIDDLVPASESELTLG